ncbi:FitA-like ribbon-helix-helix domain-containing protein [Marinimicrococcus flavescens]|uniref:Antitoxin FitA-like ribbon-helix-helix domain-containing protein n=1 Tax=Marinimicrococcus flavescens TaxID=3031815 RepID=A0AAP3UY04_9PROT|nr:hypothetical protein [Marinimicrococcus flavescens]
MATLTVRNLPKETLERLEARARAHNRSLEAEVRELLGRAVQPGQGEPDLGQLLELVDRVAAMTPAVPQTDSAELRDRMRAISERILAQREGRPLEESAGLLDMDREGL